MKLKKSLFISLIITLFISCSETSETKLAYSDASTVKNIVKEKEADIIWTKEVEGDRLKESKDNDFSNEDGFGIESIQVIPQFNHDVYPSIQDFGSLDSSLLPAEIKTNIKDFCDSISKNIFTGGKSFFDAKYLFNYYFFRKELIENWEQFFETPFPVSEENFKSEIETIETEKEDKIEPDPIFIKYFIGEPFSSENLLQIPILFISQNGTINVTIYMNAKNINSIYQITINRWEKSDGGKSDERQ